MKHLLPLMLLLTIFQPSCTKDDPEVCQAGKIKSKWNQVSDRLEEYAYDDNGRIVLIKLNGEDYIDIQYDEVEKTAIAHRHSENWYLEKDYMLFFDEQWQLVKIEYGDYISTYLYDPDGQLTETEHLVLDDSVPYIHDIRHYIWIDGNVTEVYWEDLLTGDYRLMAKYSYSNLLNTNGVPFDILTTAQDYRFLDFFEKKKKNLVARFFFGGIYYHYLFDDLGNLHQYYITDEIEDGTLLSSYRFEYYCE